MPDESAFNLPKLDEPRAQLISACGTFKSTIPLPIAVASELEQRSDGAVAFVGSAEDVQIIQVFGDVNKDNLHVHINLARDTYFRKGPPKANSTASEITRLLASFLGQQAEVTIIGRYEFSFDELGEDSFIKLSQFGEYSQGPDKLTVTQTGASFAFENAPINAISWQKSKNQKLRVELRSDRTLVIGADYLVRCVQLMNASLHSFVIGGQNANA